VSCPEEILTALRRAPATLSRGGGHVGVRCLGATAAAQIRSSWWRSRLASDTLTHGRVGSDTDTRDAQVPRDATWGQATPVRD
jgi:hypothetical protein